MRGSRAAPILLDGAWRTLTQAHARVALEAPACGAARALLHANAMRRAHRPLLHLLLGATLVASACSGSGGATAVEGAGGGFGSTGDDPVITGFGEGGAVGVGSVDGTGGGTGGGIGIVAHFPQGAFDCVQSTDGPGAHPGGSDTEIEVTLDVQRVGALLQVTWPGFDGLTNVLGFEATSASTAELQSGEVIVHGYEGACTPSGLPTQEYPAAVTVTSGALAVQGDTMLVSVEGTVELDPQAAVSTPCFAAPGGAFLACKMVGGGAIEAPMAPPTFATGTYQCDATAIQRVGSDTATSVDQGTLVLAYAAGRVTATASLVKDTFAGTFQLVPMTSSAALLLPDASGHAASVQCIATAASVPAAPLATVAGALDLLGDAVHLTVRGTAAECGSADHYEDLRCTPMAGE